MELRREGMLEELMKAVEVLPEEQLREVTDFAGFLRQRRVSRPKKPQRGSAEALLRHAGSFRFEAGEMKSLLDDIDQLRRLERGSDG